MIRKLFASILLLTVITVGAKAPRHLGAIAPQTLKQEQPTLTINLRKDFGYNSFTNSQIQGTFTVRAKGPDNLDKVVFLIDGKSIGEDDSAPFGVQFDTSQFGLGKHVINATGTTTDGVELQSNQLSVEFVSAGEGMSAVGNIILPIVGVIALAALIAFIIPALLTRGKKISLAPGAPRSYSPLGGAICPKCDRPFGLHAYGLNLIGGKLDRCPYCGKWSVVHRSSPDKLHAAEEAEIHQAEVLAPPSEANEEEKLRKELDNSKYQDL